MNEREQAAKIANMWLDFQMNPLTQMVPGDPDCDACVLARQYVRLAETSDWIQSADGNDTIRETPEAELRSLREENGLLRKALDKSIWFQSHYAALLNQYDGGRRMSFVSGDAWIARLHDLEPIPSLTSALGNEAKE
jgi:hypothetical protein